MWLNGDYRNLRIDVLFQCGYYKTNKNTLSSEQCEKGV